MKRRTRGLLAATAVLALPLGLMTAAQAEEQDAITIRGTSETGPQPTGTTPDGDVVENRNQGNGSWEFLRDGIEMKAPTSADAAGVYWAPEGPFPSEVDLDWTGTQTVTSAGSFPAAAAVVFFDFDGTTGNGNDFNALVLEKVYGQDAWLSGSSSNDAKNADPSGTCTPAGSCANDQGNNTQWFGTFTEWKQAMPNARVTRVGVNLSSTGAVAEGVVRSVTLDDDTYTFTSDAEPEPEPVTKNVNGGVSAERSGNRISLTMTSEDAPPNTVEGAKLRWRIAVDGFTEASFQQGFGEQDTFNRRFANRSGAHTVRVFKNGDQVREFVIRTNR